MENNLLFLFCRDNRNHNHSIHNIIFFFIPSSSGGSNANHITLDLHPKEMDRKVSIFRRFD